MVADYGWASDCGTAVDDRALAYADAVGYGCSVFYDSVVVGLEVVQYQLVCLEEVLGLPGVLPPAMDLLDLYLCSCSEEGLDCVCDLQFSSPRGFFRIGLGL